MRTGRYKCQPLVQVTEINKKLKKLNLILSGDNHYISNRDFESGETVVYLPCCLMMQKRKEKNGR
jgi:hypothetical protein